MSELLFTLLNKIVEGSPVKRRRRVSEKAYDVPDFFQTVLHAIAHGHTLTHGWGEALSSYQAFSWR
jgi:hypothetical protein